METKPKEIDQPGQNSIKQDYTTKRCFQSALLFVLYMLVLLCYYLKSLIYIQFLNLYPSCTAVTLTCYLKLIEQCIYSLPSEELK